MRILFVSHTDPYGPFVVGSHHYSREFAQLGHNVLHLSTSFSLAHVLLGRVEPRRLALHREGRRSREGVEDAVSITLMPLKWVPQRYTRRNLGLRRGDHFDIAIVDEPLMWSSSLRAFCRTIIYRPTDLYIDGPKARRQRQIVRSCDGIVATSAAVLRSLGPLAVPAKVIQNGVDSRRFGVKSEAPRADRAVYVGSLDQRFDWPTVISLAETFQDWEFVIAGPGSVPTSLPANVRTPGTIPYRELPHLFWSSRVGLLPLSDDMLNTGRSPMKLYEYMAAGLSVVTKADSYLSTRDEIGLYSYESSDGALDAFRRATRVGPAEQARGISSAISEDWRTKADDLLGFVKEHCMQVDGYIDGAPGATK